MISLFLSFQLFEDIAGTLHRYTTVPSSLIHKPSNPHRMMLGFGFYDANVLACALEISGYSPVWHDQRTPVTPQSIGIALPGPEQDDPVLIGFLVNVPHRVEYKTLKIGSKLRVPHWICVRKVKAFMIVCLLFSGRRNLVRV